MIKPGLEKTQFAVNYLQKLTIGKFMNWQVIAQLLSAAAILLAGPAVIVLIAFKKGNL